tara:strand:- start:1021 stop:1641 length:621 start_codon:yes stop_codon:yes gene_type:complete
MSFAVAAGVISLASTAMGSVASFSQASKQRQMQKDADAAAAKFVADARKKLDVNFYEGLSIPKGPYELAREAALMQGAMGVEAVREGDQRGAAAGVGRIQDAQEKSQLNVASQMEERLHKLDLLTKKEDARLNDEKIKLDLGEAEGAQLAARDAQEASQQAVQQGMAGVVSLGSQAVDHIPLFGNEEDIKRFQAAYGDALNKEKGK